MTSSNRREVYVTGIGRVPICSKCGEPQTACICSSSVPSRAASQRTDMPRDGYIRISRDRKSRGGRVVTLLTGVPGEADEIAQLAHSLKKLCGSGGTVKGDSIEIQGEHRDRLESRLKELGYKIKRAGG